MIHNPFDDYLFMENNWLSNGILLDLYVSSSEVIESVQKKLIKNPLNNNVQGIFQYFNTLTPDPTRMDWKWFCAQTVSIIPVHWSH